MGFCPVRKRPQRAHQPARGKLEVRPTIPLQPFQGPGCRQVQRHIANRMKTRNGPPGRPQRCRWRCRTNRRTFRALDRTGQLLEVYKSYGFLFRFRRDRPRRLCRLSRPQLRLLKLDRRSLPRPLDTVSRPSAIQRAARTGTDHRRAELPYKPTDRAAMPSFC